MFPLRLNRQRLLNTFTSLVALDSPSFGERAVADFIRDKLNRMDILCTEDSAGAALHGNAGNLFAKIPGDARLPAILFCTHMDTVEPSRGKRAVCHADGRITSAGDTVLGADDFAGVAAVLEAVSCVLASGAPHPPLELLFTVAEEPYCAGVRHFDFSKCEAKIGYVADLTGEIGTAAIAAPTILSFQLTIHGKASHAGFAPEMGINAVAVAANSIAKLPQGRLDAQTTLNFGVVSGGMQPNIVPEACTVRGEIRSAAHERALSLFDTVTRVFQEEAERLGATLETEKDIPLKAYRADEAGETVQRFMRACKAVGVSPALIETFGGSDNAALQQNGIAGIVIANAMYNCHSTAEFTTASALEQAARLICHLIVQDTDL